MTSIPQISDAISMAPLALDELRAKAAGFRIDHLAARFEYSDQHYVRKILHWQPALEIVLLCWSAGQSSSIHDHRGSNCVTRVLCGRFCERLFKEDPAAGHYLEISQRILALDTVSGLDGRQIHQISNVHTSSGGVMLNFYSPALSPAPRSATGRHLVISVV